MTGVVRPQPEGAGDLVDGCTRVGVRPRVYLSERLPCLHRIASLGVENDARRVVDGLVLPASAGAQANRGPPDA